MGVELSSAGASPIVPPEAREVFGEAFDGVAMFAAMLEEEGEKRGLIGPRELPILWDRHLINSAAVARFVGHTERVADVGSGAGFPGIVLALMKPSAEIHLIETMERRCIWLQDVVTALGIRNVTIHRSRAEELQTDGGFDVVTARAPVAQCEWAARSVKRSSGGG